MLKTEMRNEKTTHIDQMDTLSQLRIMNEENETAVKAVEAALPQIERAVQAITAAFQRRGRLFYIGAGTSGRLGVLDASECPPTFGVDNDMVIGIIAGGDRALRQAGEKAEDDPLAGIRDLQEHHVNEKDVVVGISASGGAAYVVNAIEYANAIGCQTVAVTSNEGSPLDNVARLSICTDTGAEVITGSTRLKAGTAQKLVLNMLSTVSLIRCGYVYENMMVNLKPSNEKLKNRMVRIVCSILDCDEQTARDQLESHHWNIPAIITSNRNRPQVRLPGNVQEGE